MMTMFTPDDPSCGGDEHTARSSSATRGGLRPHVDIERPDRLARSKKWRPIAEAPGLRVAATTTSVRRRKIQAASHFWSSAFASDRGKMALLTLGKAPILASFHHFETGFPGFFQCAFTQVRKWARNGRQIADSQTDSLTEFRVAILIGPRSLPLPRSSASSCGIGHTMRAMTREVRCGDPGTLPQEEDGLEQRVGQSQ